jgi:hypothetical protein
VQASVVIVNPCGTGSPSDAISARFAPLPPRMLRIPALPSVAPAPKKYTYFVFSDISLPLFFRSLFLYGMKYTPIPLKNKEKFILQFTAAALNLEKGFLAVEVI